MCRLDDGWTGAWAGRDALTLDAAPSGKTQVGGLLSFGCMVIVKSELSAVRRVLANLQVDAVKAKDLAKLCRSIGAKNVLMPRQSAETQHVVLAKAGKVVKPRQSAEAGNVVLVKAGEVVMPRQSAGTEHLVLAKAGEVVMPRQSAGIQHVVLAEAENVLKSRQSAVSEDPYKVRATNKIPNLQLLTILLMLLGLSACSDLDKIEKRNGDGVVIERFYRSKTDSLVEGKFEIFDDKGVLIEEAYYVNGLLDGTRTLYHPNGKPQYVETHVKGQFIGTYKAFYPDGQLELVGEYVNNQSAGIWTRYYPDGAKMEEVTFADGRENGPFLEWHPNGNKKATGSYADGDKEQGELMLYDEQGELERKMFCEAGICRTTWVPDSTKTSVGG